MDGTNKRWMMMGVLVAIVAVAAGLRLWRPGLNIYSSDELRLVYWSMYMAAERTLAPFNTIKSQWNAVPAHSPLTNYITAIPYLFTHTAAAGRVIFGVIGAGAVLAGYGLARDVFGRRAAWMGALLLAVHAGLVGWSRHVWNPNWGQLVGILWLWAAIAGLVHNRPRYIAVAWVMLALVVQSHTSHVLLALPMLALLIYHAWTFPAGRGALLRASGIGIVLGVVTAIPWLVGLWQLDVFTVEHWQAQVAVTDEAAPSNNTTPVDVWLMMARNLTGADEYERERAFPDATATPPTPPYLLDRVLIGYGLLMLALSLVLTGIRLRRDGREAVAIVAVVGVFWLLFIGGFLSTIGPQSYFVITATLAGGLVHGWVLSAAWDAPYWRPLARGAALVALGGVVGFNLWLNVAGLSWQATWGIMQPLEASLTAYDGLIDTWTENGEREAVVLVYDNPIVAQIYQTQRQVEMWETVRGNAPLRTLNWNRVQALPIAPEGTVFVELYHQQLLEQFFGVSNPVPQRTVLGSETYDTALVLPEDVIDDMDYMPRDFNGFAPGLTVDGVQTEDTPEPGAVWRGFLVWRPTVTDALDYQFSVRLLDADSGRHAITDFSALSGADWRPGEVVLSPFEMQVAESFPAGAPSQVRVVMYRFTDAAGTRDEAVSAVNAAGAIAPWVDLTASVDGTQTR